MNVPSTHGRQLILQSNRAFGRSSPGQPWRLEVQDVVAFSWLGHESAITYESLELGTDQLVGFWFVHIFLPLFLALERDYDFLHAAAVEIDERPVLFVAPSTGGKSTLADYFLKQGHPLLSDDKVATVVHEGRFWAVPSHPHHRPYRQFEVLGEPVANFSRGPRPLHAFYLLEAAEPEATLDIQPVTGFRKFEALMPNYLFDFDHLREQRLRWLSGLADDSSVFRISRPWSLERVPEVYAAIYEHARSLAAQEEVT